MEVSEVMVSPQFSMKFFVDFFMDFPSNFPTGAEALHGAGARFTILEGWEGDLWRLTVHHLVN